MNFQEKQSLIIQQRKELAELFGVETRNKYEILDEQKNNLGFAAEQGKGLLALFARSFLGHWRKFEIHIFDSERNLLLKAFHPFRWFFQRLEIKDSNNQPIGYLQQRFAILTKHFDILDEHEQLIYSVKSPFYKIWTFPFYERDNEVARVEKKWSGLVKEIFMDADNFHVSFGNITDTKHKQLILCSAFFIDLQYFERKADNS